MISSRVTNFTPELAPGTLTNLGSVGGTLIRANSLSSFSGCLTITAMFSERPEMYGNG